MAPAPVAAAGVDWSQRIDNLAEQLAACTGENLDEVRLRLRCNNEFPEFGALGPDAPLVEEPRVIVTGDHDGVDMTRVRAVARYRYARQDWAFAPRLFFD